MNNGHSETASPTQPPKIKELMVLGDKMLIKQSSTSTGGEYAVMEQFLQPGDGPPPHVHTREDEVFFIVAGEFDILLGDQKIRARAGDVIDAPRNIRHTYKCAGESAGGVLFLTYPPGIEAFFGEAAALGSPPDMQKLAHAASRYGLIFG